MQTQNLPPIPPELVGKMLETFFHPVDFLALPAAGNAQRPLLVDPGADFVIVGAVRVVTDVNDTAAVDFCPATVELVNGAGINYTNGPVHLEALAGTARQNAGWASPLKIPAGSQVNVRISTKAAAPQNVRLTFYGYKVIR